MVKPSSQSHAGPRNPRGVSLTFVRPGPQAIDRRQPCPPQAWVAPAGWYKGVSGAAASEPGTQPLHLPGPGSVDTGKAPEGRAGQVQG